MNPLKLALAGRRAQIGLWQSLANPYTAEICADTGYDWLLFDGEHAPNTVQTLLAQLQAVAPYPVEPVARVPVGDAAIIKQYMDIGFRSHYLDAPPTKVTGKDVPMPYAANLEKLALPTVEDIVAAAKAVCYRS